MADVHNKPPLIRLWMRLTEPDASIQDVEQRHQAQFLATLFLVLSPIGIAAVALPGIGNGEMLLTQESFYIYLLASSIAGIAYFLSRTKWYRAAAWVAVVASSLAIFVSSWTDPTPDEIEGLFYLVIPVLLGSVLLSIRATAAVIVMQVAGLLVLPVFIAGATWTKTLPYPLAFHIIASVLILLVARQRNVIERERQGGLERHIDQRTVELTRVNTILKQQIAEREHFEQTLAEEQNLLRTLIDILPDDIYIKDTGSRFLLVNSAWARNNTGSDQVDHIIGKTDYDYFEPNFAAEFFADEQRLMQTGEPLIDKEEINFHQEQNTRWMQSTKVPLRDNAGRIIGLVGISRNITQRKGMEESLQRTHDELEARVVERTEALSGANTALQRQISDRKQAEMAEHEQRLLAEALRDSAAAINSTLDLQEVLDRILIQLERVIPYHSGSIMLLDGRVAYVVHGRGYVERGFKMEDLLAVRFTIDETENLRTMYETGEPLVIFDTLQYPAWRKVEQSTWIHSYIGAPISTDDQVIGFINLDNPQVGAYTQDQARKLGAFAHQAAIAIRNARLYNATKGYANELEVRVSERTAQLERQRAQLQSILDTMNEGVVGIMFDAELKPQTRLMNRALTQMIGYGPDEWDFNLLRSLETTDEAFAVVIAGYAQAIEQHGSWQARLKIRRKDGSEFDGDLTANRVNDADNRMIGVVIVIRDISQENILQEQRSRFVANASHELRTPITNLLTRLYLLRKQPERLPEHLEVMEYVAGRMRSLVEDLLEHSRFERGVIPLNRVEVDLRLVIVEVIRIQQPEANAKRIQMTYAIPEPPLITLADPGRMTQVFTNLITNAIHYTPDGGQVHIDSVIEKNGAGEVAVVIRVQDSGIGIAPDLLPNIFRPFFRGNEHSKGTGLGLSIAKEIVEMHGGAITVESQVGLGSQFTVRLAMVELM